MGNTYTQLYIHIVFAVKYRKAILDSSWDERLRKYITGIIQNDGHKLLAINNMPDHIHIFIGLDHKFNWQTGYGAFSNSRSQIDNVVRYIQNQQEHHKQVIFLKEYRIMLDNFCVDYDEKYLFIEME